MNRQFAVDSPQYQVYRGSEPRGLPTAGDQTMAEAGSIYSHFISKFRPPDVQDLRIWWIPQIPGTAFEWRVADLAQAALILDAFAAYDDFQYAERVKGDYCNTGGLQIFDGSDWVDWEDEDGDEFDEWRHKKGI
jgi:hypothetical protein